MSSASISSDDELDNYLKENLNNETNIDKSSFANHDINKDEKNKDLSFTNINQN